MARSRRSNAATASEGAQTTLATTTTKTRARRSPDEEIAIYQGKLASALDRKLLEDVKDRIATQGADKRLLAAFTAMTRLRPWLGTETYDKVRNELGAALQSGRSPVEIVSTDNEDDDEEPWNREPI